MDSNHGELDKVTPAGAISRVVDISADLGHVVPDGAFYVSEQGRVIRVTTH